MTRRRLYYGFALGTLSLPACSALSPQSAMVPVTPPGWKARQAGFVPAASADDQFAAGRVEPPPSAVVRTPAAVKAEIETVQHREVADEAPLFVTPRVPPSAGVYTTAPEPVADAQGIIRPLWPVIRGPQPLPESAPVYPAAPAVKEPALLTPSVSRQDSAGPSAFLSAPVPPPESIIGASVQEVRSSPAIDTPPPVQTVFPAEHTEKSAPNIPIPNYVKGPEPFITPILSRDDVPAAAPVVLPAPADTPLIQAVRAFQQNNPRGALELLKAYDPATQQVLISMMPVLVQLSEGKLQQMKREEMDILLDQLTRVPPLLRPRASFQTNKLLLCREVQKFGVVDAFPAGHEFRPGDMVYLYAELANFTCAADPRAGYAVALASHLELKDEAGAAVWKADPREDPERVSTPPQDYYRAYRFCVPPALAPGKYALSIRVTDKPSGRETAKAIEFRVGAK